jgi:hypothetical protein
MDNLFLIFLKDQEILYFIDNYICTEQIQYQFWPCLECYYFWMINTSVFLIYKIGEQVKDNLK